MVKRCVVLATALGLMQFGSLAIRAEETTSPTNRLEQAVGLQSWDGAASLSWQSWGQTGNVQRYNKYETRPFGFFLGELSLRGFNSEGFPLARMDLLNLGQDDTGVDLTLHGLQFPGSFRWQYSRRRFFADPLPTAATASKRVDNAFQLRFVPGGMVSDFTVSYRHQQLSEPTLARLGGNGLGFDSKDLTLQSSFAVGPGTFRLAYSHLGFTDRAGFLPASTTKTWSGDYTFDLTDRLNLTASYVRTRLEQQGVGAQMEIEAWHVGAHYQPSSVFGVSGSVGQRWVDQPMTATAYTRQTNTADVRAAYRLGRNATIRAGYNRLDFERINRGHTQVETPRRDTSWVKLRARLLGRCRFSAKYKQQDLKDTPASGVAGTADTSPLYRDDKSTTELRLTGPVGKLGQGYVFYTNDNVKNASRMLHYQVETFGGGIYAQLTPKWSVTADVLSQNWDGLTDYTDTTGLALNAAPPGGVSTTVGLPLTADEDIYTVSTAYQLDAVTSVSGYFSKFKGTEGALINDREYGVMVRRALSDGFTCGVEWRRALYNNANPRIGVAGGLDYADSLLRVDVTASF